MVLSIHNKIRVFDFSRGYDSLGLGLRDKRYFTFRELVFNKNTKFVFFFPDQRWEKKGFYRPRYKVTRIWYFRIKPGY